MNGDLINLPFLTSLFWAGKFLGQHPVSPCHVHPKGSVLLSSILMVEIIVPTFQGHLQGTNTDSTTYYRVHFAHFCNDDGC